MRRLMVFAWALFYFPTVAVATNVNGTIYTTTWTKANSPYRVTGSINVPYGNTLTVQPGVDVLFDADATIRIQGRMRAIGTATSNIRIMKGIAAEWQGLWIQGGDTNTIEYCVIRDGNAHGASGGGIYIEGFNTRLRLAHSQVINNKADYGGGLDVSSNAKLDVVDCIINNNTAQGGGGLLAFDAARVIIMNTQIANNVALVGGGVWGIECAIGMRGCDLDGNRADFGGGLYVKKSIAVITECKIRRNTSYSVGGGLGGGILVDSSFMMCLDNIIYSNINAYGGGCYIKGKYGGSLGTILINCTFNDNSAYGIWASNAVLSLTNTIMWNDSPKNVYRDNTNGFTTLLVNYSDIQDGLSTIATDPRFVDAPAGDFRLQPDSPCIDAGDPSGSPDDDGSRPDMGALSYTHPLAISSESQRGIFALEGNYPNPFNPSTAIRFSLAAPGPVTLGIYDANGQLVRTLVDDTLPAGSHEAAWDGRNSLGRPVGSGVYFYRLTANEGSRVRKMVLAR